MKNVSPFIALFCLVLGMVSLGLVFESSADDHPNAKLNPTEIRAILEKGATAGELPAGLVIRLSACLGALEKVADDDSHPLELRETWEFSSRQVHRVTWDSNMEKLVYRRSESRPFASQGLCKTLLDGQAIEIQSRKGQGPETALVGTPYQLGSRSIEVIWEGQTILDLQESRAAGLLLYRESDARAFGALYETLATQARNAFRSPPATKK
ncbi:MAG: hypothetical protein U1A77_20950 [Pirellulales bacterium]